MTTATGPAPTDYMITHARVQARAEAIDGAADGIIPPGRCPITGVPVLPVEARVIARAIDGVDGYKAMGQIAEAREGVEHARRFHPEGGEDRKLSDHEAQGLALRAMAALGREADTRHRAGNYRPRYLRLIGDFYPVGPYVSDAVRWVLRDVEHTPGDASVVTTYAVLHNVVTRGLS